MFCHFLVALLVLNVANTARLPKIVCKVYNSSGDVYIGGIFSLHKDGPGDENCGELGPVSALQLTEAMAFAVKTINDDDTVLPNITLGFMIHDDCSRAEYALWGSLALAMGAEPTVEGKYCIVPGPRIRDRTEIAMGVLGTEETSSCEVVVSTAGLFKTPHVTYGATGSELFEEHQNPYFFATISPDTYRAEGIVDVLAHFRWEYVALIYSSDQSILDIEREVYDEASERSELCKLVRTEVSRDPTDTELNDLVQTLRDNPSAHVVVLLTESADTTRAVISAVRSAQPPLIRTWLAGDSFGNQIKPNTFPQGTLFIEYFKPKLVRFEEHFRSLALNGSNANPWYDEFCQGTDICQTSSEDGFSEFNPMLAPVMDAVFSLAHSLDKTFRDFCNTSFTECLVENHIRETFVDQLSNISFQGTRGEFNFENSYVPGRFTVWNVQNINGVVKLVDVGVWDFGLGEERLHINENLIQWNVDHDMTPKSECREACGPGFVVEKDQVKSCCWGCRECRMGDIVSGTKCVQCAQNEWPNKDYSVCDKLIGKTVTLDEPIIAVLVAMIGIALLLCGLTTCGMIRHRQHALIKASSRELSAVNIVGILLSLVAIVPFLSSPSAVVCGLGESLYVLSFTMMYAPLLLKVNRIYRIFESSTKTVRRPRFTGSTAQLTIVALLVITQVVVIIVSALVSPGTWITTIELYPTQAENEPRTLEIFCNIGSGFLASMSYNLTLLLVCCFYAYKARNVPGNFNEARFYAACVYTTLVPIVAALPMYITADKAIISAFSIGLVPVINGYVTLIFVYLSKLFAVVRGYQEQPNNNTADQNRVGRNALQSQFIMGGKGKVHPSTSETMGAGSSQMEDAKEQT
ncbi:metabotropic glutamate receptor 4-like [Asterias amurensis]|uniref:metabotropic glutamate receptor 4-like n=1 Tax=Asterias amurensis TaxID=7602 RepID=UPI003AB66162